MTKPKLRLLIISVLQDHDIEKKSQDFREYEKGKRILGNLFGGNMCSFAFKVLAEWVGI